MTDTTPRPDPQPEPDDEPTHPDKHSRRRQPRRPGRGGTRTRSCLVALRRVWIPSPNYSSRGGTAVRLIVVHTAEGATTYQSLGSFFANPSSGVKLAHRHRRHPRGCRRVRAPGR